MTGRVRYRGFIADTARWDDFVLRDDDIVISTPSKSGTTWMQTIVALLLFDGLPDEPITEVSPWLDVLLRPWEEVRGTLAAQRHRRFIKTHAPLDGLPVAAPVTVVTVGRDPRDVLVSMLAHLANIDDATTLARRVESAGDEDLADLPHRWPESQDPRDLVPAFIEMERHANHADVNLANVLDHLHQAWLARHEPTHLLVHYADLTADLPGEMRRVRDALGVELTDERVGELAALATFASMKGRAATAAPEATLGVWRDATGFFRGGRHGDGAEMMTDDERRRYDDRCRELVDDERFLAWVHGGRAASEPDAR